MATWRQGIVRLLERLFAYYGGLYNFDTTEFHACFACLLLLFLGTEQMWFNSIILLLFLAFYIKTAMYYLRVI